MKSISHAACSRNKPNLSGIALLAVVSAPPAVVAQENGDIRPGLEEVVVTARRHAESLQDVPMSVAVVSDRDVVLHNISDLRDLDNLVPSLVQTGPDSNVNPAVAIRGISSDSRNIGFESGVSVYIDGVYTGRPTSFMQDLMDVERIEVLRGPQGTLFGKNTIAGAINIVTRKPGEKPELYAEAQFGNYGLFRQRLSVSGPLVGQTLSGKFSVYNVDRDGIQTNVVNGKDYWNENNYGGRAQLRVTPSESLDIGLSVDGLREKTRQNVNSVVSGFGANEAPGPRDISIDAPVAFERKISGAAVNVEYTAGDTVFTSITAHRANDMEFVSDDDATSAPLLTSHFRDEERQFTQEFRMSSRVSDKFNYVAGLYYYDQRLDTNRVVTAPAGGFAPVDLQASIVARVDTEDYAVFAQGDYRFTDALTLTLGLRYTHEKKTIDMNLQGLPPFGIISLDTVQSKSDDAPSPTISLAYALSAGVNTYFTISRGFKAGGYNADFIGNDQLSFDSEEVTNFEAGVKMQAFDDRLRFNLAAYHMNYDNLQVSVFRPGAGFVIDNAAKANIDGAEVEIEARPGAGFELTAGIGYNQAKFDQFQNAAGLGVDFDGNDLPNAPRWNTSFGAQYSFPIGNGGSFLIRGDYTYRSDYYSSADNLEDNRVDGYSLVNGVVGFTSADGRWDLQLWGKNLTDKLYANDKGAPLGGLLGSRSVVYGMPRTYGVRVAFRL